MASRIAGIACRAELLCATVNEAPSAEHAQQAAAGGQVNLLSVCTWIEQFTREDGSVGLGVRAVEQVLSQRVASHTRLHTAFNPRHERHGALPAAPGKQVSVKTHLHPDEPERAERILEGEHLSGGSGGRVGTDGDARACEDSTNQPVQARQTARTPPL